MKQLLVYADFHFLPASQKLGVLNYDRVRGNEVFSFSYDQTWLDKYGNIRLGEDLNTFPGVQYAPSGLETYPDQVPSCKVSNSSMYFLFGERRGTLC
jgi:serine/threonine-protein kinase HipA